MQEYLPLSISLIEAGFIIFLVKKIFLQGEKISHLETTQNIKLENFAKLSDKVDKLITTVNDLKVEIASKMK